MGTYFVILEFHLQAGFEDAEMQNKLYKIMWKYILSGDMTDEQITAVQKPERM